MAVTFSFLGPIITVLLVIILVFIALRFGKFIVGLAINSLIGLVILFLLNFLPIVNIEINIWSILIAALAGVPGIALLILLDLAGIAF